MRYIDQWQKHIIGLLRNLPAFPVNGLNLDYVNNDMETSRLLTRTDFAHHNPALQSKPNVPMVVALRPIDAFYKEIDKLEIAVFDCIPDFEPNDAELMLIVAALDSDALIDKIGEEIEHIIHEPGNAFSHHYILLPTDIEALDSGDLCINYELSAIAGDRNIAEINSEMCAMAEHLGIGVDKDYLPETFRPRLVIGRILGDVESTRKAITTNKDKLMHAISGLQAFRPHSGVLCFRGDNLTWESTMLWAIAHNHMSVDAIIPDHAEPATYSS